MKRHTLTGAYGADGLLPMVLPHGAFWAIEESAARTLLHALRATDPGAHRAEFEARRASFDDEPSEKPFEFRNGIAYIGLAGAMTKAPTSMDSGCSTVYVRRMVRQAASDPDVKGVMLVVDSPGGSVSGTGDLAADVAALAAKKPTCAFIEDCCCSAAYWVASQCGRVVANATAIVGSIGTYAVVEDLSKMADKLGVTVHVLSTGPYKGAGVPGTEITDEQLAEFQRTVDELNEHFVSAVAQGRRFDVERARGLADGRVHVGASAMALGLVDSIGCLDEAAAMLQSDVRAWGSPKARAAVASATEHIEPISSETEPPTGSTLADESKAALIAVRGLDGRMRDLLESRKAQGRPLSSSARAHAAAVAESLGELQGSFAEIAAHQSDEELAEADALESAVLMAQLSLAIP